MKYQISSIIYQVSDREVGAEGPYLLSRGPQVAPCAVAPYSLHQFGPFPKWGPICIISAQFPVISSRKFASFCGQIFGSDLHQFAQQILYRSCS